tara:strand:- start:2733 stop:4151 length:1419 start_codon:yes stop_codon:yes gene_type:complete
MHEREELYIGGKWISPNGEGKIEVLNPTTEEIIGSVPIGNSVDLDLAINSARDAFTSWSNSSIDSRIDYLNRLTAAIKENTEMMAQLITSEVGTPIEYSRMAMVGTPRVVTRSYAKILESFQWEEEVRNSLIVKEPVGVVGMITPWNFPLHQIIGKVAPAIASGCTMVLKPSKEAPLNSFFLADLIHSIDLPKGVFNLVSGHGRDIGEKMAKHPELDMISFTGSTSAGIRVSELASQSVKRVSLELGGKSANVILKDADIARASSIAVNACFGNSGQECSALTRLIVPKIHLDQVIDIVIDKIEKYKVGNPLEESTRCGPLISKKQQESVNSFIRNGIEEGAKLLVGGEGMPDGLKRGFFVKPTAFSEVRSDMTIFNEEIFGPVLSIISYEDEAEALELANNSEYGLSGGVWSSDESKALNFARKMRTGQVSINGGRFNVSAPFGGYKKSGNGRELGIHGLEEFLEVKSIQR